MDVYMNKKLRVAAGAFSDVGGKLLTKLQLQRSPFSRTASGSPPNAGDPALLNNPWSMDVRPADSGGSKPHFTFFAHTDAHTFDHVLPLTGAAAAHARSDADVTPQRPGKADARMRAPAAAAARRTLNFDMTHFDDDDQAYDSDGSDVSNGSASADAANAASTVLMRGQNDAGAATCTHRGDAGAGGNAARAARHALHATIANATRDAKVSFEFDSGGARMQQPVWIADSIADQPLDVGNMPANNPNAREPSVAGDVESYISNSMVDQLCSMVASVSTSTCAHLTGL